MQPRLTLPSHDGFLGGKGNGIKVEKNGGMGARDKLENEERNKSLSYPTSDTDCSPGRTPLGCEMLDP